MSETTLHFDSARDLQVIYANDPKNLKLSEEKLDVKLTSRDGWIKIAGRAAQVEKAKILFEHLDRARQKGVTIRKHEFRYALQLAAGGDFRSLASLYDSPLPVSPKKPPVSPKTLSQKNYIELMRNNEVVFGAGPAGTGKTYLAIAMAIHLLKAGQIHRIVLTRPAVEAGESLGFLPGDLQEKLLPYLRPLYDAMNDLLEPGETERLVERNLLEIAPLAYMRGRTLHRACVVLDEAQNTTTEQMFMLLTRLGPESKCFVTGDTTQIDLPNHRKSGLVEALQALTEVQGVGIHVFNADDVVRHEIVHRIIEAYRHHRGQRNTSLTL